jgi:hypothetical protein
VNCRSGSALGEPGRGNSDGADERKAGYCWLRHFTTSLIFRNGRSDSTGSRAAVPIFKSPARESLHARVSGCSAFIRPIAIPTDSAR